MVLEVYLYLIMEIFVLIIEVSLPKELPKLEQIFQFHTFGAIKTAETIKHKLNITGVNAGIENFWCVF